jgi:endonuclease YncB( thermonuclease family)
MTTRICAALVALSLALAGCGGGGGLDSAGTPATTATPQTAATTYCGYLVGTKTLQGTVTRVHDGDTLTLSTATGSSQIRLDAIDAPELAQPFGSESQSRLSALVFGKNVTVAYSKTDQYDRIVGAVFSNCEYVNLTQVASGQAWFYKAYQCELSAEVRTRFAEAQDAAVRARLGLWSQADPEAPWFFRNGREPVTPSCTSDLPSWSTELGMGPTAPTVSAGTTMGSTSTGSTTSTTSSGKICYVGPRGGSYTLTANGNKNYSGC